ncbi:MAG: hypothetical protein Q8L54_14110, partial [Devosia sp.]|nr:hypothetical protein [Devosia sp.]
KQIETPRSPDPIMRRPSADREEKRVTHGTVQEKIQEQLDRNDPIREDSQTLRFEGIPAGVVPGAFFGCAGIANMSQRRGDSGF